MARVYLPRRDRRLPFLPVLLACVFTAHTACAQDTEALAAPQGVRVFTCGHSFHVFVPGILKDLAQSAGVGGHEQVGMSSIGGSRVIQHWNVADEKNKAKEALRAGKVDVLTMSPIYLPDEGIENFARLAVENNPNVRVLVQAIWLPFDQYDPPYTKRPKQVDHDALGIEALRKLHEPYFRDMDEHVRDLNRKFGKTAVYVVPVGQAVLALREKAVAGKAPGLKAQSDLFTDAIGHARSPLQALVAYCHFATIYRRTPVGLPLPAVLRPKGEPLLGEATASLNRLLQELAWDAVRQHPLSGVTDTAPR